jgi:hypothetical protein
MIDQLVYPHNLKNKVNEIIDEVKENIVQGIGVWDTDITYPIDGLAKGSDGKIYKAVLEQNNNNPTADDGNNWVLIRNE